MKQTVLFKFTIPSCPVPATQNKNSNWHLPFSHHGYRRHPFCLTRNLSGEFRYNVLTSKTRGTKTHGVQGTCSASPAPNLHSVNRDPMPLQLKLFPLCDKVIPSSWKYPQKTLLLASAGLGARRTAAFHAEVTSACPGPGEPDTPTAQAASWQARAASGRWFPFHPQSGVAF